MPHTSTIAFDVDLGRVHGYSTREGRVCYNAPEWPFEQALSHDRILIEVASPVLTGDRMNAGMAYNRRTWAIGNSFMVGRFAALVPPEVLSRVLVSPSTVWTDGMPEDVRERVAGCAGQDNHDIRACRCMLVFYALKPSHWVPLVEYYDHLHGVRRRRPQLPREARRKG